MPERLVDREYLRVQYDDDERLRIRIDTHERFSEDRRPFREWVLERVDARSGQRLLDVGSGPGEYHQPLVRAAVDVVAVDTSSGMLAKVRTKRVQAQAEALPFADASFDRVMANHMLYHVPDRERALREMRRVARSPGRVVVTTNARVSMRRLFDLVDDAATATGLPAEEMGRLPFALEDTALVRTVFPDARVDEYDDALRFPSAVPVLRYVDSMWVGRLEPQDRARVLARLADLVGGIIAREGTFRVPKRAGSFVADV